MTATSAVSEVYTALLSEIDKAAHDPVSEQMLRLLRKMNQNTVSDGYFRLLAAFYLGQVASTMRAQLNTEDRGLIPINVYALLLAPSGFGKTKSMQIMEKNLLGGFYNKFLEDTLPDHVNAVIDKEAIRASNRNGTDLETERQNLETEYKSYGAYVFAFPEGSGPAYRQIRAKCQMAEAGSTNFVADEIGFNLLKSTELLDIHFEVYDVGDVKDKITKNSSENKRYKQRGTPVPANLLAFGTPDKLFDGGPTEKELLTRLDSGYSRRFLYGVGSVAEPEDLTPEELYDRLVQGNTSQDMDSLYTRFTNLADINYIQKVLGVGRDEGILLTTYKMYCCHLAEDVPAHLGMVKAELQHRYFRALKIAGAYAFASGSSHVTKENLLAAMKVTEESGKAFHTIISRPKSHVRLAEYISSVEEEVTHADLIEQLPFYPSARNKQEEMMTLAIAWGYRNHKVIRRTTMDNIDFFKGETLKEVDMDKLRVSHSYHEAYQYQNVEVSWAELTKLCQVPNLSFTNHHMLDGHREDNNTLNGVDYMVWDCDGGVTLQKFAMFMKGTMCHVYTTKRHTNEANRFRVLVPLKYRLNLNKADYKEFINNVLESLPFEVDSGSNQRSKKWLCNPGSAGDISGEPFDPLPFLPNTRKNEERIAAEGKLGSLDRVQKYFARSWTSGAGRNNTILRYALLLMDTGHALNDAMELVRKFNAAFSDPLEEEELNVSVFQTMAKRAGG